MHNPTDTTVKPIVAELVPDQEDNWRKEITAMTVQLQNMRTSIQDGEILRGVHPKSHGCLDAEFVVNPDLDRALRVGLFAEPGKCFRAKIRYSNADVLKRADFEEGKDDAGNKIMQHASRGMAIKVLDVHGPVLLQDECASNQDFLMVNTPEFAFRNVRDYRRLTLALLASGDGADPRLFFLPAELLRRGAMDMSGNLVSASPSDTPEVVDMRNLYNAHHEVFEGYSAEDIQGVISAATVVDKIRAKPVRNPLSVPYFSAAPFRFGPDRVMRYCVEPVGNTQPVSDFDATELDSIGDDYLSQALSAAIADNEPITLSFKIQIASACDIEGKIGDMIENASLGWDEAEFPFIEVARLKIVPDEQTDVLVDACKPLLFTPWHALADHEPLGGINRLRKPVYSNSATFRRGH